MVLNRMGESNAGTGAVAAHREARARTTSARRPRRARPAHRRRHRFPGPSAVARAGQTSDPGSASWLPDRASQRRCASPGEPPSRTAKRLTSCNQAPRRQLAAAPPIELAPPTTPPGAGHHVPTSQRSPCRSLPAHIDATTRCSTSPDSRDRRRPSSAARSPGRSAGAADARPDARHDAERAAWAASASVSAWTSWSLVIFVRPWTSRSAASAKSSARLIPLKACCSACPRALGRRAGRCG